MWAIAKAVRIDTYLQNLAYYIYLPQLGSIAEHSFSIEISLE